MGKKQKNSVEVVTYKFTGTHFGFLKIPESWCRECDLTVHTVESTIKEDFAEDADHINYTVKPWFQHLLPALFTGWCFHPPCTYVNGEQIVDGDVPNKDVLAEKIEDALHQ